jgi:tetratricopeptide (TPR) repeat protein
MAPCDGTITRYIWKHKYKSKPTYEQAIALFQPKLAYDHHAMEKVADTVLDQPVKYEELLSKAAELNPADYFELGDYFEGRDPDKAAAYIEKGNALDPDSVRATYYASWLVSYYLKNGKIEAARREADFAGEVYSYVGLKAKAEFLEAIGENDGAFEWYSKIEERYGKSQPLIAFYIRHKAKTGSTTYDSQMQSRVHQLFPDGIEKTTLKDFKSPPEDGTLIREATSLAKASGLKVGDIIVGVYGIRIHNFKQYICVRDINLAPEMDLIVWQEGRYLEIKASPPDHRFGGDFGDYIK